MKVSYAQHYLIVNNTVRSQVSNQLHKSKSAENGNLSKLERQLTIKETH